MTMFINVPLAPPCGQDLHRTQPGSNRLFCSPETEPSLMTESIMSVNDSPFTGASAHCSVLYSRVSVSKPLKVLKPKPKPEDLSETKTQKKFDEAVVSEPQRIPDKIPETVPDRQRPRKAELKEEPAADRQPPEEASKTTPEVPQVPQKVKDTKPQVSAPVEEFKPEQVSKKQPEVPEDKVVSVKPPEKKKTEEVLPKGTAEAELSSLSLCSAGLDFRRLIM